MNCLTCEFHEVQNDSNPDDWFNDDDQAVFCLKTIREEFPKKKKYPSDYVGYRPIAVSSRPYHLKKESKTPKWCPLGRG